MQDILVLITFSLALGFLVKKFIWLPLFESKSKPSKSLDGSRVKCGKSDCGCQ